MLEPRPPSVSPSGGTQPPPPGAGQPPERPGADPLASEVAREVRELRLAAGLSERAAARLLGTSQTQLRRMEDPRYLPSLRSLARLAAAYGHRLRVEFEARDKQAAKAARPAARPKAPQPRAKLAATRATRAPRTRGRRGR